MTILLHGEDVVRSRQKLGEIRSGFSTQDGPLFAENNLIVCEGVKNFTPSADRTTTVVIWEGKKITAAQITTLAKLSPELKVEEFPLAPIVFKFLEAIRPGNQKEVITLWRQYLTREEPEIAMAMICRQVRLLITQGSDFPPWQRVKLEKQAKLFGTEKLKAMEESLLIIDYRSKIGFSGVSLATQLELWLLSL